MSTDVDTIDNRISAISFGTAVTISSVPYTFPSDGYVRTTTGGGRNDSAQITVNNVLLAQANTNGAYDSGNVGGTCSAFVRKGMILTSKSGTSTVFIPISET